MGLALPRLPPLCESLCSGILSPASARPRVEMGGWVPRQVIICLQEWQKRWRWISEALTLYAASGRSCFGPQFPHLWESIESPSHAKSEDFEPLTFSFVPTTRAKDGASTWSAGPRWGGAVLQELKKSPNVFIYSTELNNLGNCSSGTDNSIRFHAQLGLQS